MSTSPDYKPSISAAKGATVGGTALGSGVLAAFAFGALRGNGVAIPWGQEQDAYAASVAAGIIAGLVRFVSNKIKHQ